MRELEGSFTRLPADRVHVAYAQSYLAVRRLVDASGGRSMRELLAAIGEGKTLDERVPGRLLAVAGGVRERLHSRTDTRVKRES